MRSPSEMIVVLLWPLLIPSIGLGQSEVEEEVRVTQTRRFAAMVRGDVEELKTLLADELTYTHTSGQVETKAEFLATLESGVLRYVSIEPEEVQIRVYGEAAVVTGRSNMRVRVRDRGLAFPIRFVEVYTKRGGRWQLVTWQSTRLPEEG